MKHGQGECWKQRKRRLFCGKILASCAERSLKQPTQDKSSAPEDAQTDKGNEICTKEERRSKMPKGDMLSRMEAKIRREYEAKLEIVKAEYNLKLKMALQQCCDAAMMAIDDVFDVNEYSAEKFFIAHTENMNEMSRMAVEDGNDDPEMVWTKKTVDTRLRKIVGEKNFAPWDERYVGISD